ncbi:MAG: AAA family ATPase, partial [Bdellovibrionota bacterium]
MIKKDSKLIGSGLLEAGHSNGQIKISGHVTSYLSGLTSADLDASFLEVKKSDFDLELQDFSTPLPHLDLMRGLLQSGTNILLYGAPGTGKSECARSLVRAVGADAYWLKQTDEDGDESLSHRKTALVAAQNLLRDRKAVLIVDECDPILNTMSNHFFFRREEKGDEKSWINQYLENSKLRIIWITNRISGMDESTKRRFSFAQDFRLPERRQRLKAWQIQIAKQKIDFIDPKTVESLASQHVVSPGTISLALRDVSRLSISSSPAVKVAQLRKILEQQQVFASGRKPELTRLGGHYALEGLNTDISLETVGETIARFYKWKQNPAPAALTDGLEIANLNLLLLGPPGTGKTEFVKHLAEGLDKELLVKRTSDLLSKYVGEAEQNIASAFNEAEARGAILFLDEADSLFINREGASRSWEVSQTNELLCQMENFKGVLVCATNFEKHLDPAVLRRFGYKVRFDYLKPEANLVFFRRILTPLLSHPLTMDEESSVTRLSGIAPGDFKVVYQKHYLSGRVPPADLIRDLEAEVAMRRSG